MKWIMFTLIFSLIALTASAILATNSLINIVSPQSNVVVKHSRIKINNSTVTVTFTLSSPLEGKYQYMVYCNYTNRPFFSLRDGIILAGGSFTYTLYVNLEPNKTLAVNIKIWWEDRLVDEVTHYIRAED